MAKTTTEKIESVKAEIRQLENRKKSLQQEYKVWERKARTKRLIERGAILESLVEGSAIFSNEQIKAFLERIISSEYARNVLAELKGQATAPATTNPADAEPTGGTANGKTGGTGIAAVD